MIEKGDENKENKHYFINLILSSGREVMEKLFSDLQVHLASHSLKWYLTFTILQPNNAKLFHRFEATFYFVTIWGLLENLKRYSLLNIILSPTESFVGEAQHHQNLLILLHIVMN